MGLQSDSQGFLVGEPIETSELLDALEGIRSEISALRRDLANMLERKPAPGVSAAPGDTSSRQESRPAPEGVATPSRARRLTEAQKRDARGRFVGRDVIPATPANRRAGSAGEARSSGDGDDATTGRAGSERSRAAASASAAVPTRDARGRFVGRSAGSGEEGARESSVLGQNQRGDGSAIADAISSIGDRLRTGLGEINEEAKGTDPTVQAANEIAQPLARGFKVIFGGGQRSQNRWFARFWQHLRKDKREDDVEQKRQRKILENIEDKPVAGDQGGGLWRLMLLLIGPLAGVLALMGSLLAAVVGLPLLIAGGILKGLGVLLGALGLKNLGKALAGAGGRVAGRGSSARGGRAGTGPIVAGGAGGGRGEGQRGARGGRPPITGDVDPERGGRLGRGARALGRRIPGIGALLTLGFMATDVGASESSDASREEKDRMTGRAVGGGVGALGGMAAGGMAGAAIGSVVPVVGTVIGGLVGSIAGAYFAGNAGAEIGEHVGGWVNEMRGSDLVEGVVESFRWAADFTAAMFGGIGDWMRAGWDSLTETASSTWASLTESLSERWDTWMASLSDLWTGLGDVVSGMGDAANAWIKDKTGVDVAETAKRGAGWIAEKAGQARDAVVSVASAGNDYIAEKTGVNLAETVSGAATSTVETVKETAVTVAERTKEVATSVVETTAAAIDEATKAAQEFAKEAVERATDAAATAAEKVKEAAEKTLESISDAATAVMGLVKQSADAANAKAAERAGVTASETGGTMGAAGSGAPAGWELGQTSERFESGGRGAGTVSTGAGDHGGVSYGTYQLSTNKRTVHKFLEANPEYGKQFAGMAPGSAEFSAKWKEVAAADPSFGRAQYDFIKQTHYDPQVQLLKKSGIDLSGRGAAVQDALWSTSVQFGGGTSVIKDALGGNAAAMSDEQIITAIQDYKIRNNESLFASSSAAVRKSTLNRAHEEKAALLGLAQKGVSATGEGSSARATLAPADATGALAALESRRTGSHVDVRHLEASTATNMAAFIQDAEAQFGKKIEIVSGYRPPTEEEKRATGSTGTTQESLSKSPLAASTYSSMHGRGEAVDLRFAGMRTSDMNTMSAEDQQRWLALARKHDLAVPLAGHARQNEWWHVEPAAPAKGKRGDIGLRGSQHASYIDSRALESAAAGRRQAAAVVSAAPTVADTSPPSAPADTTPSSDPAVAGGAAHHWSFAYKGATQTSGPGARDPIQDFFSRMGIPQIAPISRGASAQSAISVPKVGAVAAPQEISIPLSSPGKRDTTDFGALFGGLSDVTRDLSDRRLAHIVTGSYSHAGAA